MPTWDEILKEVGGTPNTFDLIRRKYIKELSGKTGRNTIIYYSAFLQKTSLTQQGVDFGINDNDKNGFMTVVNKLDRSKGLDLILHTPGGNISATESIVFYLKSIFGNDIRAIIPQISMSAGTMIACACKEIIMGKQSNLGPIDPQLGYIPAHGLIEEFNRIMNEVKADPSRINVWREVLSKYHPTLIGECEKAIKWSESMVSDWLMTNMFHIASAAPNLDIRGLFSTYKLHNGIEFPIFGFGAFSKILGNDNDKNAETVLYSLKLGYKHISVYQTERAVGEAIVQSGILRNEIFISLIIRGNTILKVSAFLKLVKEANDNKKFDL